MSEWTDMVGVGPISESADSGLSTQLCIYRPTVHLLAANVQLRVLIQAVLRIRIEKNLNAGPDTDADADSCPD